MKIPQMLVLVKGIKLVITQNGLCHKKRMKRGKDEGSSSGKDGTNASEQNIQAIQIVLET